MVDGAGREVQRGEEGRGLADCNPPPSPRVFNSHGREKTVRSGLTTGGIGKRKGAKAKSIVQTARFPRRVVDTRKGGG